MKVKPVDINVDDHVIEQYWNDDYFQSKSNIRNEKIDKIFANEKNI